jgi:hypothetical protein
MHITYHGLSCFKIVAKTAGRGSDDVTIILGPFDKKTGLKPLQGKVDLVLLPHTDPAYGTPDSLRGEPIILDFPGEYSVAGINVVSLSAPADMRGGTERGNATISILDIEDMKLVYLGGLGSELSPDQYDAAAGADILFLPIGDEQGLDGKTAEDVARKLEAKVIIPMQFKTSGVSLSGLRDQKDFCSNIGNCPKESIEKLVIKTQDLEGKVMDVCMLKVS